MQTTKKRKFVNVNEQEFVIELMKHPWLYNPEDPNYKNVQKRDNSWNMIGDVVGLSEFESKKRWRSLRDGYIKALKQPDERKWVHFDIIHSFYHPFTRRRRRVKQNQSQESEEKCQSIEEQNETLYVEQPLYENAHENTENTLEFEEVQETEDYEIYEESSDVEETPETIIKSEELALPFKQPTEADPDEAFLQSCLPILKRLPNRKNVLARLRIQQILFELEFDEKYVSAD